MPTYDDPLPHYRVRDDIKMILLTITAIVLCLLAIFVLSFVASASTVGGKFALMAAHTPAFYRRIDVGDFNRSPSEI